VPVTLYVQDFERPPPDVEATAYFCILEALANSAKHAGASEVVIELRGDPHLQFVVSDDGRGFEPGGAGAGGLLGMEARVASVGGTLAVESAPGAGTTVRGAFPATHPGVLAAHAVDEGG
jgi:signal transduction histidine kinase